MADTVTLSRHRPRDGSSAAIRDALMSLRDEHALAHERIASETERRASLLLAGTDKEIHAAEAATRDAELTIERADVLTAELTAKLSEAVAIEAGEARAAQVREASDAIEKFNGWLTTKYEPHARAIAEGVALERIARRLIMVLRASGLDPAALPAMSWSYVGTTFRGLENLTRLPSIAPGEPIVWP